MEFDFETYFFERLQRLNVYGLDIQIANEQIFSKKDKFNEKTTYVVIKDLPNSVIYGAITQPKQITILCDQNEIENVKALFDSFVLTYNWKTEISSDTYVKQMYESPSVLSNFAEISYGYRSILYMDATIITMENITDISDLKIDNIPIKPLSVNLNYVMSGNTQPISDVELSETVKNVATLSLSISLSLKNDYTYTDTTNNTTINLLTIVNNIMNGTATGNRAFTIKYTINTVTFTHTMRLVSAMIVTNPSDIPSLQLGFMV